MVQLQYGMWMQCEEAVVGAALAESLQNQMKGVWTRSPGDGPLAFSPPPSRAVGSSLILTIGAAVIALFCLLRCHGYRAKVISALQWSEMIILCSEEKAGFLYKVTYICSCAPW